ncbi:hypothetical protein FGF66_04040 [Chlorobaculum thiosulfatiphilum]|uniref:Uncharacterized protein n=2 Tax=Chlorobaculum thiosulfatiphilum TaxID=115852 RepID=A0A5C4S8T2_CHLTI|nr:hypothetical protein FGF66_04040 [Chlorobaculum thiosulfatiphilum]
MSRPGSSPEDAGKIVANTFVGKGDFDSAGPRYRLDALRLPGCQMEGNNRFIRDLIRYITGVSLKRYPPDF